MEPAKDQAFQRQPTRLPRDIDFSRATDFFDINLLKKSSVGVVGLGGAHDLTLSLARCGIGNFYLVDFDKVEGPNISTQGYYEDQIGDYKVVATADELRRINADTQVTCRSIAYEEFTESELIEFWEENDIVLAMTDNFETQCKLNVDSLRFNKPCIFAAAYLGMDAVEVTYNMPGVTTHCHHCAVLIRYEEHEQGYVQPKDAGSHILAGKHLNSIVAQLTISAIHHYVDSDKPITSLIRYTGANNFILSKLLPAYGMDNGVFDDETPFTTKLFEPDTLESYTCKDCGAKGVKSCLKVN